MRERVRGGGGREWGGAEREREREREYGFRFLAVSTHVMRCIKEHRPTLLNTLKLTPLSHTQICTHTHHTYTPQTPHTPHIHLTRSPIHTPASSAWKDSCADEAPAEMSSSVAVCMCVPMCLCMCLRVSVLCMCLRVSVYVLACVCVCACVCLCMV